MPSIYKLKEGIDINWERISYNKNAIELLEKNQNKIDWCQLAMNENGARLMERNLDKVDWEELSGNVNLFTPEFALIRSQIMDIDKAFLEERTNIFKEELMSVSLHPSRIKYWLDCGVELGDM